MTSVSLFRVTAARVRVTNSLRVTDPASCHSQLRAEVRLEESLQLG